MTKSTRSDLHWFILLLRRPLACMPETCRGRTSCCCKELPRPSEPELGPAVIPPPPTPLAAAVAAAVAAAAAAADTPPESKEGGLIATAAVTGALAGSRELRASSGWDCCDSDSSTVEPPAMLPLPPPGVFLLSFSRGSSWHRWPMLRLMHLVQGLSYPKQTAHAVVNGLFALKTCSAFAAYHGSTLTEHGQGKGVCEVSKDGSRRDKK